MAVASLILGILALLISFSIFKDLSLILAVLGFILGIIPLIKKKSKGMSIAGIILAVLSLIILFSNNTDTVVTSNQNTDSTNNSSVSQESKLYGLNDEITVKQNGNEYTLVITNIQEMSERNEFSDKTPAQVFLIDYTYKNISSTDSLYISDMNFKIIDAQGEIGDTYPNDTTKSPQSITTGTTCKAQMVLCINNPSSTIKLQYYDNMFNGTPDATFEINL